MTSYNKLSLDITKAITKQEKQNDGIYFTPPDTIQKNIEYLRPYFKNINSVLEPSCGSCEYITALQMVYPHLKITGVEKNLSVFDAIKHISNDNVDIQNGDFLKYSNEKKYDLIIGNPPYFVMKKKEVEPIYYEYFDGRPNIFILFIIKALSLLNEDGILSFILPKNFLNCLYYSNTRKFIYNNFKILTIMKCDDKYIDTQQETVIIIIKNCKSNDSNNDSNNEFTLNINGHSIFGEPHNITKLTALYKNSVTLKHLDFNASVGTVVWNQHKDILTSDDTKTRLIYSSDIHNRKLEFKTYKNDKKKNFIDKLGISEPLLVVNRGYGKGSYKFDYCLITDNFEYLIENHLMCIKYTKPEKKENVLHLYDRIIKSLNDERTREFVDLYFGNNAINTTELNTILPIY